VFNTPWCGSSPSRFLVLGPKRLGRGHDTTNATSLRLGWRAYQPGLLVPVPPLRAVGLGDASSVRGPLANLARSFTMGSTGGTGLRVASPRASYARQLGIRFCCRTKPWRARVNGPPNNRVSNNRMNRTRSASETDGCGPCRLSACSTRLGVRHRLRGSWSSDQRDLAEVTTQQTLHLCGSGGAPISLGSWYRSRHSERLGQGMHRVRVVPLPTWRGRLLWAQPTVLVCQSSHQGLPMSVSLASGSAVARSHGEPE